MQLKGKHSTLHQGISQKFRMDCLGITAWHMYALDSAVSLLVCIFPYWFHLSKEFFHNCAASFRCFLANPNLAFLFLSVISGLLETLCIYICVDCRPWQKIHLLPWVFLAWLDVWCCFSAAMEVPLSSYTLLCGLSDLLLWPSVFLLFKNVPLLMFLLSVW